MRDVGGREGEREGGRKGGREGGEGGREGGEGGREGGREGESGGEGGRGGRKEGGVASSESILCFDIRLRIIAVPLDDPTLSYVERNRITTFYQRWDFYDCLFSEFCCSLNIDTGWSIPSPHLE